MTSDPNLKQELKEYLDTQLEEKVKSIQIEYLKEHFLTKQEFLDAMERLDKRFDAMQDQMDKRFDAMQDQMDKRFDAMQDQMDKRFDKVYERFEAIDKRFVAMQVQMDKRFERVYERFDQMDFGHTDIVEGIAYIVVKRELKQRGHDVNLKIRHHFTDSKNVVHPDTQDVEIDILHTSPNVIGEATLKLTDIEKVRTFIRKIQFIENYYNEPFERFFFCYTVYDWISNDVNALFKKYNIELIVPATEE